MRIHAENQEIAAQVSGAVGVAQTEIVLPDFGDLTAYVFRNIEASLATGSAAPSKTGAGLTIALLACSGEDQASPTDLLQLKKLLCVNGYTEGSTAAAGLTVAHREPVREIVCRGLWVFTHMVNITNAATTVFQIGVRYDVFKLTQAEYLALIS